MVYGAIAEFQSKAQSIESRCVAVTQPHYEPKSSINVPRVTAKRFGPPAAPESTAAAATPISTPTANTTSPTAKDEPASRGTNSERVPTSSTNNTNISGERYWSRPTSYAVPGTNECFNGLTANTGPTGACLTCGPVGATRLDSSDKEYGSGLEPIVSWHRPRDNGLGYATERVRPLCQRYSTRSQRSTAATCTQRSSRLGLILLPLIR